MHRPKKAVENVCNFPIFCQFFWVVSRRLQETRLLVFERASFLWPLLIDSQSPLSELSGSVELFFGKNTCGRPRFFFYFGRAKSDPPISLFLFPPSTPLLQKITCRSPQDGEREKFEIRHHVKVNVFPFLEKCEKAPKFPEKGVFLSSSASIGDLHTFAYGSAFPHFSQTATAALFLMTALLSPFPELTDGRRVNDSLSLFPLDQIGVLFVQFFCLLCLSNISSPPSTFFVRDLKNSLLVPRPRRMICLSRKSSFVFALLSFGPLSKSAFIFMLGTKAFFFFSLTRTSAQKRRKQNTS